ncbi:hypothetical protein ACF0H5_008487 [Mactra antiquata]
MRKYKSWLKTLFDSKCSLKLGVQCLVILTMVYMFVYVNVTDKQGFKDDSGYVLRNRRPPLSPFEHFDEANESKTAVKFIDVTEEALNTDDWNILLTVNDGYFDFFRNWLWYYMKLNINLPITVVAEDDTVFTKIGQVCEVCTVLRSNLNISDAVNYSLPLFRTLVSTRPMHILTQLLSGKNTIYSDVDMVWMNDPRPYFDLSADMNILRDSPTKLCTGFIAIKSNNRTTKAMEKWHARLEGKSFLNQRIFNLVVNSDEINVDYKVLNTTLFPSGRDYFGNHTQEQRSKAIIVHNNWIVGHGNKKERFREFNLWKV